MSEAKFTKGPWRCLETSSFDYGSTEYWIPGICTNIDKIEDARLVKAAPEMFELLNEARDFITGDISIGPAGLGLICVIDELLAEIRGE